MQDLNLKNIDPRMAARAADYVGTRDLAAAAAAMSVQQSLQNQPNVIPGRGPVMMPMAMPGPQGGYNRYREMTLEEMLLENRVVFLVGEINHVSASRVIMQMLYLQSVKKDSDINFYINSPGGVVDDTLAMYDIMKFLTCDIATYCIGRAESGGAIVFAAGKRANATSSPTPRS
jgi:ATP-dependent Clp protease protease subunit